jgi:hypothetical protein
MSPSWRGLPKQKIEVGSLEIQDDSLSSIVWRIENAVSRAKIVANDYQGKYYIEDIDVFDVLKISYRYGDDSWTQVFEGVIEEPNPSLNMSGQVVSANAFGYGQALLKTHCHANFGRESENDTLLDPEDVWDDLVDNRVNLNFDAGATGYALTKTKIKAVTSPTIYFIKGGYRNNFDILNQVCLLVQADQAGSAGVHWFVDPSKNLWIDTIAAHTVDTANWPTWWKLNQADSTLTEGQDFTEYNFRKSAKGFANKIVLFSDLRKPGYDYYTEDSGGQVLWGRRLLTSLTDSAAAGQFVVGSHSLLLTSNGAVTGFAWYPSSSLSGDAAAAQKDVAVTTVTHFQAGDVVRIWDNTPQGEDATIASIAGSTLTMVGNLANAYTVANNAHCTKQVGWDIDSFGSEKNPPTLNFYYYCSANTAVATTAVQMITTPDPTASDYYYARFATNADLGAWHHCSIPIGSYWKSSDYQRDIEWVAGGGAEDWNDINAFGFYCTGTGASSLTYIDDLHISGKLIREAYNSTSITANNEYQKPVRLEIAVDDSMKAADDSGTAAQLAYAELLHAQSTPVIGFVKTLGAVDVLPGQLVYINADKQSSGSYRIADSFRIKQITHQFTADGFFTVLDLTDDLVNTFAVGPNNLLSELARVQYVDPEAKSLKSGGIDTLVNRLSKDYP